MPRGLWLPECYATPALTGIGRRLIRRALDYIIQVQDEHFHVYFREYPLFTKGSFFLSLMLLFLELTWRTSQRKWISRWDIICLERLYEEDSFRQSSGQNDAAATAQTRSREKKTLEMLRSPLQSSSVRIPPTREIHFFNRFSVFCFFVFLSFHAWVQTHWGSGRGSRGADTAELNSEPWKSERDKRAQNACEGGSSLPLID